MLTRDEQIAALIRQTGVTPIRAAAIIDRAGVPTGTPVEPRETGRQRENAAPEGDSATRAQWGVSGAGNSRARHRGGQPEKDEQRQIIKAAKARGAFVYELSQPRESMQTRGLPDLYLVWPDCALWWEVKSETGVLSQAQATFMAQCLANGTRYGFGTASAFRDWCDANGRRIA